MPCSSMTSPVPLGSYRAINQHPGCVFLSAGSSEVIPTGHGSEGLQLFPHRVFEHFCAVQSTCIPGQQKPDHNVDHRICQILPAQAHQSEASQYLSCSKMKETSCCVSIDSGAHKPMKCSHHKGSFPGCVWGATCKGRTCSFNGKMVGFVGSSLEDT